MAWSNLGYRLFPGDGFFGVIRVKAGAGSSTVGHNGRGIFKFLSLFYMLPRFWDGGALAGGGDK